jgi:hypothetical protein
MTIIEATTILALGLSNSPFTAKPVWPSLMVEHRPVPWAYIKQTSEARCEPASPIKWNPVTALWGIEGGVRFKGATVGVGHVSEHGVSSRVPSTESYDYVKLTYRMEFP